MAKYFVYFHFKNGTGFVESGEGRMIVDSVSPISNSAELAVLEEAISNCRQCGEEIQIINLTELKSDRYGI